MLEMIYDVFVSRLCCSYKITTCDFCTLIFSVLVFFLRVDYVVVTKLPYVVFVQLFFLC